VFNIAQVISYLLAYCTMHIAQLSRIHGDNNGNDDKALSQKP